jgi:hypothetical protein
MNNKTMIILTTGLVLATIGFRMVAYFRIKTPIQGNGAV